MDSNCDLPEERSPRMAEAFESSALLTKREADAETDPMKKQTLMDRYHRLMTAAQSWASRYTTSTGEAYRGC